MLTQLDGRLPPEVRRAALERLGDSYQWVRWYALRILGQLPEWDDEVCVALEEQVILDDNNRIAALRLLGRADPARAFPLLVEEIQKVAGREANSKRMEAGLKALRLVEGPLALRHVGPREGAPAPPAGAARSSPGVMGSPV